MSNLGNVRGVRGHVLHPYSQNGYPAVDVGPQRYKVHRLVLETFIGYRPDGLECCHWDDVKTNNRLDNLRWDDKAAQQYDFHRNVQEGRAKSPHYARRRTIIARKLAVLDRLEQLACSATGSATTSV